jgi:uncharacterized protein (DUF2235 family)
LPRNLVICCDGTNNEFGRENTSVVRLVQALDLDPSRQLLFYDPGVGTLPEPQFWTRLGKWLSKAAGLAFGLGLMRNVSEAYLWLMDTWAPGDRVFHFGFSRGAYTVRVLAGLLHSLGLLPRGNENLIPYLIRLYQAAPSGESEKSEYWKLCEAFRWTFARPVAPGDGERRFPVHFLGVWDTVSSVGWAWDPKTYVYTAKNPGIRIIRHAVSIDERRWFFRQNQVRPQNGQDVKEYWFPGVHSDVGGGYAESEGGLWRAAFEWMLGEAIGPGGLLVDAARLETIRNRTPPPDKPWNEPQHESLTWKWWPAEFFPKLRWNPETGRRSPALGLFGSRYIPRGAMIHSCALRRIREINYAPRKFPKKFLEKIRALREVPEALPFERE